MKQKKKQTNKVNNSKIKINKNARPLEINCILGSLHALFYAILTSVLIWSVLPIFHR